MRGPSWWFGGAALAAVACSGGGTGDGPGEPPADAGADAPALAGEGGVPVADCSDGTDLVWLVSDDNTLHTFDPRAVAFARKGTLACPSGGARATSMAVDRHGVAYVRHSDGSVWRVDTRSLACTPFELAPPQDGFAQFGMGFSTETAGGVNERLFLADSGGRGLARLDTATGRVEPVGAFDGAFTGKAAELTGTGDGKLYGLFVTVPMQIAPVSKGTGEVGAPLPLADVYAGDAWAFAFHSDAFWVFTHSKGGVPGAPAAQGGSDLTRVDRGTGRVEVLRQKIGFRVVGAGVSTCAPTVASPR